MNVTKLTMVFFSLGIFFLFQLPAKAAAIKVGEAAPALIVPTLGSGEINLETFKSEGKVVVIHFWATWCPACRKEMPLLNEFYKKNRDEGLEVIGLSVDRQRDREQAIKFMQHFDFPGALLNEAKANKFGSPMTLPATYIVDQQGIIRKIFGAQEDEVTEQNLDDAFVLLKTK